jgi:transposase
MQLLWVEYRQAHPDGYGYSHFCDHYQKWRRKLDVVLRQEHKAGEKVFVDWAGPTIPVHERTNGLVFFVPHAPVRARKIHMQRRPFAQTGRDLASAHTEHIAFEASKWE